MRRFDNRKQSDSESIAEFEQALRILYREAWPNTSSDQRDAVLKRRFEDGVHSSELSQYLRLHTRDLDFTATVEKARIFTVTVEQTRPKKAVKFVSTNKTEPSVNLVQSNSDNLRPILDSLKHIQSQLSKMQTNSSRSSVTERAVSPNAHSRNVSQSQDSSSPAARPTTPTHAGEHGHNQRGVHASYQQQHSNNSSTQRGQGGQNWDSRNGVRSPSPGQQNRWSHQRPTARSPNSYGRSSPNDTWSQRPPRTDNQYRSRSQSPTPFTSHRSPEQSPHYNQSSGYRPRSRNNGCWVCGMSGCHSSNHQSDSLEEGSRPSQSNPNFRTGNVAGVPGSGNRNFPVSPSRP